MNEYRTLCEYDGKTVDRLFYATNVHTAIRCATDHAFYEERSRNRGKKKPIKIAASAILVRRNVIYKVDPATRGGSYVGGTAVVGKKMEQPEPSNEEV